MGSTDQKSGSSVELFAGLSILTDFAAKHLSDLYRFGKGPSGGVAPSLGV